MALSDDLGHVGEGLAQGERQFLGIIFERVYGGM